MATDEKAFSHFLWVGTEKSNKNVEPIRKKETKNIADDETHIGGWNRRLRKMKMKKLISLMMMIVVVILATMMMTS
jgi:hypothetical protein